MPDDNKEGGKLFSHTERLITKNVLDCLRYWAATLSLLPSTLATARTVSSSQLLSFHGLEKVSSWWVCSESRFQALKRLSFSRKNLPVEKLARSALAWLWRRRMYFCKLYTIPVYHSVWLMVLVVSLTVSVRPLRLLFRVGRKVGFTSIRAILCRSITYAASAPWNLYITPTSL